MKSKVIIIAPGVYAVLCYTCEQAVLITDDHQYAMDYAAQHYDYHYPTTTETPC